MKKLACALAACLILHGTVAARDYQSRSFMFTRPASFNTAAHQQLWHLFVYGWADISTSYLQAIGIFQHSLNDSDIARYFLFNGQQTLTVRGDQTGAAQVASRDIRAEWLNLYTGEEDGQPISNFSGDFSIAPWQKQDGFILEGAVNLHACSDWQIVQNLWVGFELPFFRVENDIRLTQKTITPALAPISTIADALRQPDWEYSKFGCEQSVGGASELRLKVGTRFECQKGFQVGTCSGVLIPFGRKADPAYIFSPYLSFNKHYGFLSQVNFQIPLTEDDCPFSVCIFGNLENVTLFANEQYRSIDLWNNPWSRYLKLRQRGQVEDVTIPAINVLTRKVHVSAYNMADASFGIRLCAGTVCAEIGYNVFARSEEHICLKECWAPIYGIAGTHTNQSASKSTIKCLVNDPAPPDVDPCDPAYNANFVVIQQRDLDMHSAAAAQTFAQRYHAALGYYYDGDRCTFYIGGGVFGEMPHNNATLKLIGGWGKIGAIF